MTTVATTSERMMRAVVHDRYGPPEVLRLDAVAQPVPANDELLVKIHATTVTQTDCHMRRARPLIWRFMLGWRRPKRPILGSEFAGEVAAVGRDVTKFEVGDRVFGMRAGAHAEYVCVPESRFVAHMPERMTFEEAAAVSDGFNQGFGPLERLRVGESTRILVYGASGSCGTSAVQVGKHYFGAHVTAVCNTENVELVRGLGADEVVDYLEDDFTRSGETYDIVFDAVGKHSFLRSRRVLAERGVYVATDRLYNFPLALLTKLAGKKRVQFFVERPAKKDILLLKELIEAGKYRAVVDRTYPLEEVVEATRYVESWQKTGNVVLTLDGSAR